MSIRIRLLLSYDGKDFQGWQKQVSRDDCVTVQSLLEKALFKITQEEVRTFGSGRTDSGVHAKAQNVHFDIEKDITTMDLAHALNSQLPPEIVVQDAWKMSENFHALSSASEKIYVYRILQAPRPCPLRQRYAWWMRRKLNLEALQTLADSLVGEKDFKSFQTTGTDLAHTVRTIHEARWREVGDELQLVLRGNGFLKQMVRNIVGTMVDLERGGFSRSELIQKMAEIIAAKDRQEAGTTAPAHGLCLEDVVYPPEIISMGQLLPV